LRRSGEINGSTLLLFILGTLLSAWPFFRRPQNFSGYVYPRYMVPAMIWLVGFFPALYRCVIPDPVSRFTRSLQTYEDQALLYLILCLLMFWVGFKVPLRSRRLTHVLQGISFNLNSSLLRFLGVATVTATALFLLLAQGSSLLQSDMAGEVMFTGSTAAYIGWMLVLPLNVLAVVFYGLGWPEPEAGNRFPIRAGALYVLFLASLPLMAKFSRGAGLMPMFMLFGYVGRWRRVPIWGAIGAFCFLIYAGHVGLAGRGLYGHYAGIVPYIEFFASGANFSWENWGSTIGAADALTPLSVCVEVHDLGAYVDQMSPLGWLIFQIPVPHIAGLGGTYTTDLTWYVGGHGAWGYTSTMFGDSFIHLGWWGCLAFVYVGMLYRLLENTVESCGGAADSLGIVALTMLPSSYAALAQGVFNTYRGWNSMFTFGIGLVIVILWGLNRMIRQPDYHYQPEWPSFTESQEIQQ
jgi:hypothetical protein